MWRDAFPRNRIQEYPAIVVPSPVLRTEYTVLEVRKHLKVPVCHRD